MKTKLILLFIALLFCITARANKFYPTKSSVDGSIYLTGNNYDTVVFRASTLNVGMSWFCYVKTSGTPNKPIVFINEGLVENSTGFAMENCSYIKITGTGTGQQSAVGTVLGVTRNWSYGFYFHDKSGQAANIWGYSHHIEIEHIRVSRMTYFFWVKNEVGEVGCDLGLNYPNAPIYNIVIHDNYLKGCQQDGMYMGSTAPTGGRSVTCREVGNTNISAQGTGYTSASVTFTLPINVDPTNQIRAATGTATLSGGKVVGIVITDGGAYRNNTVPLVNITGNGTGANATANMKNTTYNDRIAGRMYNIAVYGNYLDSMGRTAMQFSGINNATSDFFGGKNVIYDNLIKNAGWEFNGTQGAGIFLGGMASRFNVYNNRIDSTWSHAIFSYGVDTTYIHDNVVNATGWVYGDSCDRNSNGACIPGTSRIGVHTNFWQGSIYQNIPFAVPPSVTLFMYINNSCGTNTDPDNYKVFIDDGGQATSSYATTGNLICGNGKAGARPGINYSTNCTITNQPPTVNAGANKTYTLPINSHTFQAIASDPEGGLLTYLWTKQSGPNTFTFSSTTILNPTVSNMVEGVYTFKLQVTDNGGLSTSSNVKITINPKPNQPPVCEAGNNVSLVLPVDNYTFMATASDPDGGQLTYLWTKTSGGNFTITNPNILNPTVDNLEVGVYQFTLTVTDDKGVSTSDIITITVDNPPNSAPSANAGTDFTMVFPDNSYQTNATATDIDGTIVSYKWTKKSGPVPYTISNDATEDPLIYNLAEGTYVFTLTITDDDGATNSDDITIIVQPQPNQPPDVEAGDDTTIVLPVNYYQAHATITDDGSISDILWTYGGTGTATISNTKISNPFISNLSVGTHPFTITVTDNNGAVSTDNITITVQPKPNTPPSVEAGPDINVQLPANTADVTGSATDGDGTISTKLWTKVSGSGTLSNTGNYTVSVAGLTQGQTQLKLTVVDNSGASSYDTMFINVSAAANIAPVANAGVDATISLPANSYQLSGSGTDADGTITAYKWKILSGAGTYTINNNNISNPTLNFTAAGTYTLSLTVTDNSSAVSNPDTIVITVLPEVGNASPVANAGADVSFPLLRLSFSLNGSGSFDNDGTIVSYMWTQVGGPETIITNSSYIFTEVKGLQRGNSYMYLLTVIDDRGAIGTDTITVVVTGIGVTIFSNQTIRYKP